MIVVEWVFWASAAALAYVYVGYPAAVFAASRIRPKRTRKSAIEPMVSVIIAAYNEERHIAQTIENKLTLDYPESRLELIVVSDASSDATDEIIRRYAGPRVTYLRQPARNGKTAALNVAVQHARGDVLVFADANSWYDAGALRHLVANFADPEVGYVTGKLVYATVNGSMTGDGCGIYMRYENFIRSCESALGSIVGVNGGIDAVRRGLYTTMAPDDLPDLVLPLRVVAGGHRVVYEPSALSREDAHSNPSDEYRMRVRVSLRALWTMAEMPDLLDVRRHGFYALQLLSHKALRYFAFMLMASLFATAALLWPVHLFYRIACLLQVAIAACAALGFLAERRGRPNRALSVPYYFVLVNVAAVQAFVKFLRAERHRVWSPRLS